MPDSPYYENKLSKIIVKSVVSEADGRSSLVSAVTLALSIFNMFNIVLLCIFREQFAD